MGYFGVWSGCPPSWVIYWPTSGFEAVRQAVRQAGPSSCREDTLDDLGRRALMLCSPMSPYLLALARRTSSFPLPALSPAALVLPGQQLLPDHLLPLATVRHHGWTLFQEHLSPSAALPCQPLSPAFSSLVAFPHCPARASIP